ncbi:DUF3011 domain-containing protein [Sandaracinobacter sp. RS1-74]|uniref:DUF3011 domain-containing protein n=1 Tax=Sandaracinobacteroides sayramensis TaxID=2913411 RepID=UPI001EDC2783|nr:DUF3011 domain-containing protein [Sandaracinobacteroides sayramensis]MCG2841844.1 DUF3011 domain-containing protein [Sandaracinobacteroides sayramensis]
MRSTTFAILPGAVLTGLLLAAPAGAQVAQTLPGRPTVPTRPTPPPQTLPAQPSGPGHSWDQSHNLPQYFAGTTRCESQNHRTRTCRARTQNRVEIVQVHGGSCQRGRSFSYDANGITVSDGCRATFAYGYGNVRPRADSGPNALPWLLAGAGATAGIVAIANSGGNDQPQQEARPAPVAPPPPPPVEAQPEPRPEPKPELPQPPFPALPPAKLEANIQMLTPDQQRSMQICLFEAARQTGVTGGTHVRLDSVDEIVQGNGGWRFRFRATGTWPNGQRQYNAFCRATPTQIIEFTASR